jgi:hypothetical protein
VGYCLEKFRHYKISYTAGLHTLYLDFISAFLKLRGQLAEKPVKTSGKAMRKNVKTHTERPIIDYALEKQDEFSLIETPLCPPDPTPS